MKKIICLLLVVVLAMVGLVACGESASTEPSSSDSQGQTQESQGQSETGEKKLVGLAMLTQSNPYFVALAQTVEQKAAEYGWDYKLYDSQYDSATELQAMEDLISQEADVILIDNVDPEACVAGIQAADAAGIPVIAVDSMLDTTVAPVVTAVLSASTENGMAVGRWLVEEVVKDGEIKAAMMSGVKGNPVGQLRRDGMFAGIIQAKAQLAGKEMTDEEALAEAAKVEEQLTASGTASYPDAKFEIVGQAWGEWNAEGGMNGVEDMITAHPDVNVLLSENDDMAMGGMNAIENNGLTDQITIAAAADGQKEAYALIKEGKYGATGENNPVKIATTAMEIAYEILVEGADPDSYEKETYTPAACINASNVDEYYDPDSLF